MIAAILLTVAPPQLAILASKWAEEASIDKKDKEQKDEDSDMR